MGKAKWGGVAAAVAIAVVFVLLMRGVFTGEGPTDPASDGGGATAQHTRVQDTGVGVDEDEQRESTISGDAMDAATEATPGDDQDTGVGVDEDEPGEPTISGDAVDAATEVAPGDDQDTGVGVDEDEPGEPTISGDAVDAATEAAPGDDQDTGIGVDEDGPRESTISGEELDVATVDILDDGPEAAEDRVGSNGTGATVDTPESVAVEESRDAPDEALQAEAETFVRELAESSGDSVSADRVEGFMGPDRTLSSILPGSEAVATAPPDTGTAGESGSAPDTAAARGAPDAQSKRVQSAATRDPRPEDADAEGADTVPPQTSSAEAGDSPVSDAPETAAADASQARVDLPLSEETPVTIAELLGAEDAMASDAVFYVHTVRPDDDLGIWGIVHDGITENFAEGVAVHRGDSVETYRVDIPSDADQLDADQSSSFLGKIIYDKSRKTYVYNYRTDRLGRNPDLIMPGQEIVIVSFTPEELIEIYKYFARDR
ncbi:MAG: hypothetical protein U5R46_01760 [Gammaproteobacteria bacterium]|nr:hypothetical protein [Gammaproteobacteria bacterium]